MFIGMFFHLRAQFDLYMFIKHTIYLPSNEGLTMQWFKLNSLHPQGKQISLFIGKLFH